jgi:DNA-binding response OmpR family regulator
VDVLIAEDDAVSRRLLEATLESWGYAVRSVDRGDAALSALAEPAGPRLAVLDWVMPGMDGPDVCRSARALEEGDTLYLLLLTAKHAKTDIVRGLESGADDFVTKPFDHQELRARLAVGCRIIALERRLRQRVADLERAMAEVKQLRDLLPICSYCKRIREGEGYTKSVEAYLAEHSDARFSHGVCPECYEKHVLPGLEGL